MNAGKVVVITGGARGIGRGLVDRFLATNHYIVSTCDVREKDSDWPSLPSLEKKNDDDVFLFRKCDVSKEEDVEKFIDATVQRFGRIDGLVNNAATASPYMSYDNFEDIRLEEFEKYLQVNLTGSLRLMKRCVPYLRKASSHGGGGGSIVNIGSTRAQMSEPRSEGYAASKGGIEALTHAAAISLREDGIRVNCVAPGWIQTPSLDNYYEPTKEDHGFHPVGRVGNTDDVFGMCEFLLDSEKSGFVTGQTITVDGGVTRQMVYPE